MDACVAMHVVAPRLPVTHGAELRELEVEQADHVERNIHAKDLD